MKSLDEFVKKKRYLIWVDSDGRHGHHGWKHIRCFGPCMVVKEWGLEEWQDQVISSVGMRSTCIL